MPVRHPAGEDERVPRHRKLFTAFDDRVIHAPHDVGHRTAVLDHSDNLGYGENGAVTVEPEFRGGLPGHGIEQFRIHAEQVETAIPAFDMTTEIFPDSQLYRTFRKLSNKLN